MFAGLENIQTDSRRGWSALVCFTLQAAAVAAALAIPLLYPNSLPDAFASRHLFVPISSRMIGDTAATLQTGTSHSALSTPHTTIFVAHDNGFHFTRSGPTTDSIDQPPTLQIGSGPPNSVFSDTTIGTAPVPPIHPAPQPPVRISRAMQGYLIHRVEPAYPQIAIAARVEGPVLIKAIISTEGKIEQAQVIAGPPLLSRAALDAIRQWRYRPYYLNDKPVEVETEITVNFYLAR